jgi:outer membrane protein TolC
MKIALREYPMDVQLDRQEAKVPYRERLLGILLIFLSFSGLRAQPEKKISLTLEECLVRAIKGNLEVAVEVMSPEIAKLAAAGAGEKFLPALGLRFRRQSTNQASYSWIQASDSLTATYSAYSAGIEQLIPTGGKLSLGLESTMNDSNTRFQTINPYYGSTLTFDFSQPLLKDFGSKASRNEILVARNNQKISESEFRDVLLRTIYNVDEAYWNLVYSIDALEVSRQSLRLAEELLEKNRKEIEIGSLAPKEILSAQSEVALRRANILKEEAALRDNMDRLRTLISLPREDRTTEIVPTDKPSFVRREMSYEEALSQALANRPDLMSADFDQKNKDLELGYARNQLLPALNLNLSFWSPGISGTQVLYLDNNPLSGIVVGKIPGGPGRAFQDARDFKYQNWSVYLTLDIPFNTIFSRAAAAQAKLALEQSVRRQRQLEQQAELEIETTLRAIRSDYEQVEAYGAARDLAAQKLQAEEEKFKAGLSSNYFVLQYQRDLAQARSLELRAIVNYKLSNSLLDKVLGISLKTRNINLADLPLQLGP